MSQLDRIRSLEFQEVKHLQIGVAFPGPVLSVRVSSFGVCRPEADRGPPRPPRSAPGLCGVPLHHRHFEGRFRLQVPAFSNGFGMDILRSCGNGTSDMPRM